MTAFTRTASGDWSDAAKWDVGVGYPDGIGDTADLATFDVTVDVDVTCGNIDLSGTSASLTVPAGRVLNARSSIYVRAGTALTISGTLAADPGYVLTVFLYDSTATYTANAGAEFQRVRWYVLAGSRTVSDLVADCSEPNLSECMLQGDGSIAAILIDISISMRYIYSTFSSTITINAGIAIKILAAGNVSTATGGKIIVNGTRASPVTIDPRVAGGAWTFQLYGGAPGNSISNLICTGSPWTLGNATDNIIFARYPASFTPINRGANIDNDPILGRGKSRIHHKGNQAAIVEISGIWAVSDRQYDVVDAMMNSGDAVGLTTDELHMPCARVIMHEYKRERGKLYWPYTITLLEDD